MLPEILVGLKLLIMTGFYYYNKFIHVPDCSSYIGLYRMLATLIGFTLLCFLTGVYMRNHNKTKLFIYSMVFWSLGLVLELLASRYYNVTFIIKAHSFYIGVYYRILGGYSINYIKRLIIPMVSTFFGYVVGKTKEDIGL